ncbi:MAG: ABC transporter substrate-binding protein, partial [Actinomycetota bacterium]|nr:ABC transporter substrate-binding protein [Actinomycetota bacterium]
MHRSLQILGFAIVGILALISCSNDKPAEQARAPTQVNTPANFPMTVENCGHEITFDEPPDRVVLIGVESIPVLAAVDALDRVVARTGEVPFESYDPATRAAVERIPALSEETNASDTVEVSLEEVITRQPDLVIGYERSGISRQDLQTVGIPLLVLPAYCVSPGAEVSTNPTLDAVYETVEFYGKVFDKNTEQAVSELRARVRTVEQKCQGAPERSGAALFVYTDAAPPEAYGNASMSDAQMQAAGITNVFGDLNKRIAEVNFEEIVARDPDQLILINAKGTPEEIKTSFVSFPGAR